MNETYDHPTSSADPPMHAAVAHSGILAEPTQSQVRRNRQFSWCLNVAYGFLRGVQGLVSSWDRACFLLCEFEALVLFLILTGCPQKAALPNKLRQAVPEQSSTASPSSPCFCGFSYASLEYAPENCAVQVLFFFRSYSWRSFFPDSPSGGHRHSLPCQEPISAFVRVGMSLLPACSGWIRGAFNVMLKSVLAWLLQLALISLL